jgi:hypothetical protein
METPPQNQEAQQMDDEMSMRDLQKQAPKRMGRNGKPATGPRLAQQQRPQSPSMMESAGGAVGEAGKKAAKSAFKKYLPLIAGGGSIVVAEELTRYLFKLI